MIRFKERIRTALLVVCCFAVCLGVGVTQIDLSITASAETVTRSMTKIAATAASSNTAIYFYAYSGDEAKGVTDWTNQYTFVEGTGDGVKYNGETLSGYDMKQPGNDIYFGLGGKTAVAGDILTLDGTFRNESLDSNIVIDSGALTYNGSSWDRAYYTHNLGEMVLSWPSEMAAHAVNTQLYITPKSGETVPYPDGTWSTAFTYESGDGLKLNGSSHAIGEMKSVDSGLWFNFGAVNVGDVISISGTYTCATEEAKYVLAESKFQWNGTVWENYVEIEYTSYTVNELSVHSHSTAGNANANNTTLWLHGTGDTSDAWAYYTCESGTGVKLNGSATDIKIQDFSGGLYLKDFSANEGDVITIGGTFVNEERATKYIIAEHYFQWNGSGWVAYVPPVVYEEYTLSNLQVADTSMAGGAYCANNLLSLKMDGGATVSDWPWFVYESGVGFTVNGESAALTGGIANAVQDTSGGLYFQFAGVNVGDVVSIGGVFSNADLKIRYTIPESKFTWTGSAWEVYVPPVVYEEYTLSNLQVADTSMAGGAYCANNVLSLKMDGGATVSDWPWFVYESGEGFKVNGETAQLTGGISNAVQDTSGGLYFKFNGVNVGDVVSIGGVFANEDLAIRYTIPESKFTWTGSEWKEYVEYTIHNIGALELHNNSAGCGANVLYLQKVGGAALPVLDWDHVFTHESGDGWKVNGVSATLTTMKSTNDGLYLDFEAVPKNAVVSISGTFVYSQAPVKYVIDESKFVWNGSGWEKYVEYTEYNVSNLTVHANSTTNTTLWISMTGGATVSDWPWFKYVSGAGFKVNGEAAALTGGVANAIQDFGGGLYFTFAAVEPGDIVSIGGTFTNADLALRYVIPESQFTWNGSGWVKCYADSQLATYDLVGISDLGWGIERNVNATTAIDNTELSYEASEANTTGSVKFRFGFNSTNLAALSEIRLRGTAWQGIRFIIGDSQIKSWYSSTVTTYALSSNTDYVVELGAIDLLDGESIWIYAKVNNVTVISDVVLKTAVNPNEDGTPAFSTFNTNNISCYFNAGVNATFTDLDHVQISYVTPSLDKTVYDYADKNSEYELYLDCNTYNTFIGWVVSDALYQTGDVIEIAEDNIVLTALEIDFRLEDGAAIRVAGTADESGIRFTTLLKETDLNTLKAYIGEGSVSYGTLIIAYDYLAAGQEPNLEDFTSGENIIKIASTYSETNANGYVVYRGAMQKLYEENYGRLFAGRGYMEITLENGEKITVYTPFDKEDNVRSIRQIAQAFKADTSEPAEGEIRYATLSETRKAIVDAYASLDEIKLMNYAAYAANNFFNVIAWNYPALDESNEYNNEKNIEIATQMKNTGIKVVNLTGKNLLVLNTQEAIEKTRQIIKFFWSQGLKTVAFAANNVENFNVDFTQIGTPDFSDCEGFIGFLHWDEPTEDDTTMSKLADLAIQFNNVYAGSDVTYMNNLLPSYAPYFQTTTTHWWGGSSTTLDKDAFRAYVKEYCDKVLSQVKGEKWLSVDSYPINKDYSLHDTFLLDLGVIKYYAMEYGAHAHVALQSSGFGTDDNDTKARIPTEAEMRMQAYAALAFGMDSISWFTYSPSGSETETFYTFVDNDGNITNQTAFDAFTKVNKELAAIGAVYNAFEWQGIILGAGKNNDGLFSDDTDYIAFETVSGQIGDYELSVNDTKHLSSVSTNKTDWNYLMSVMQDANGNEGYVLCNYNSHDEDRTQTITLTFNKNITEVVIYRGGVAQTVSVTNNTLAIELATGEGVIVLPSKLG